MSGHSKWSKIKRQKGAADTSRGQLFTKLGREIAIAARQGGGDPESNFRLRLAVQKARDSNMPLDNIDRAIKRATGETSAQALAEVVYEGYGPGGSAILIRALTDNKNRTSGEIRNVFTRSGGNMAEAGAVAWMFDHKGIITITADKVNPDDLALAAIDVGADDVKVEDNMVEVYTPPNELEAVRKALETRGYKVGSAELSFVPKTPFTVEEKAALQGLKLLDKLESLDDVQHVFTNADFPDDVLEKYRSEGG